MEIGVVSKEIIKPSSPSIHTKSPHKLCLFDQLIPNTYMSLVLFYHKLSHSDDTAKILTNLKQSLSETLNSYYIYSGRIKNNLFAEDFDAGVPFFEAQIDNPMSGYLNLKDIESLNLFVPFKPLEKESESAEVLPLLAFQANVFSCGGIAIGVSSNHKAADGASMSNFLNSWASLFRHQTIENPNLSAASHLFRPVENLPKNYCSKMERIWFHHEGNFVTRRFVFDAESIQTLISMAGSPTTRNEAVTCFVWKHATEASRAVSGDPTRISAAIHAVNLRPRLRKFLRSDLLERDITGNFFWLAVALSFDLSDENSRPEVVEFGECAVQLRRAMEGFDSEFIGALVDGRDGSSELMSNLDDLFSLEKEISHDLLMFTNWKSFFNDVDFGLGKPFWVGPVGKVGPVLRDYVTVIESCQFPKGIEVFVYMDEAKMSVLERDEEFLKFASPNPDFI